MLNAPSSAWRSFADSAPRSVLGSVIGSVPLSVPRLAPKPGPRAFRPRAARSSPRRFGRYRRCERSAGPSSLLAPLVGLALAVGPRTGGATTAGPVIEITAPTMAGQRAPAVSWEPDPVVPGDGIYLLVWEDNRDAATNGVDLFAARIRRDGTQVDPQGVSILEASVIAGDQLQPSLVFAQGTVPRVHFLAWTDPRNGITDIYAATFITSTMTTLPSAGFRVTTSAQDSDAFPAVAFSGANYLVAYQTNVVGGGRRVSARRVELDETVGPPTVVSDQDEGGDPAAVGAGSDFVVAYETGLARLRAARVPQAAGPVRTATISTSTSGQGLVRLTTLGSDVFAIWQDNRNVDRDIYGVVLDPVSLLPRGSEVVVSAARGVQQSPDVTGDASGGLAIWQDRRNSAANAEIYATRLGPTGTVLDPEGFPIFSFRGNAFEPAVVKGPEDDYLVVAVRFGMPSRLFYRIVRDEEPTGSMTPSGRLSALADGVDTATIGFGPAQGASGFPVVDGTLYDVLPAAIAPLIVEPDADPTRPGHQVRAVSGRVQVTLRSTQRGPVTLTVQSVEGVSNGTGTVEFRNVPPVATNIRISPAQPRSLDDLTLTYDYFDVNGDPEMGSRIVWLRNLAIVDPPNPNDPRTMPATQTARGQVWRAQVQPSDGTDRNPLPADSSTVTIGNTPPAIADALLRRDDNPNLPTRTGDRIVLAYRFTDEDRDNEGATRIRWSDRGMPVPALDGARAVDPVEKGQVWQVSLTPNDGFEDGPTVSTPTLEVVNTAPTANAGMSFEALERTEVTLDGSRSSDPDPRDVLEFAWTQIDGPPVTLDDPSAETPSFPAPSVRATALLRFSLVVSDGTDTSSASRVAVTVRARPDADDDGLDDDEEVERGTDPNDSDSDDDTLLDGLEVENGLDPLDQDVDDDGLRDGLEGSACRNDCPPRPFEDPDGDGLINALDPDSDDDGLFDGLELGVSSPLPPRTEPFPVGGTDVSAGVFVADLDVSTTTDPTRADTDLDNLTDAEEDANRNGRVDPGESDPNDALDPGIACTNDDGCPGALVCVDGRCAEDDTLTCNPLPDQFMCCRGSCGQGSEPVDAICVQNVPNARCPVDAVQCIAGSCTGVPEPAAVEDSGCTCSGIDTTRAGRWGPSVWVLLSLLAVGLLRRGPRPHEAAAAQPR